MEAIAVVAAVLLGYAAVERRLRSTPISAAMVFTAVGLLASAQVTGLITSAGTGHWATGFLELTLVIVLFTDAMGANAAGWAVEAPLPARLLGAGLPLTMAAGWAVGLALFPAAGVWGAALLAAVLAPTDSALGVPVISDERVPRLIRHALNVEGGLNDGLALPFVTIFLAAGLAAGLASRGSLAEAQQAPEELASLGVSASFVLFGALFLAPELDQVTWTAAGYALLSLAVIRMIPVGASLLGSGLAWRTVAYIGWFGPRGLASIVFADLVASGGLPEQHLIVPVVMLTVGLSVLLHGVTAPWGARRYGRWYAAAVTRDPGIREAAEAPRMAYRARASPHPPP
jgi:sodium/hydrogen antiporter